jgi:hypothetical protein
MSPFDLSVQPFQRVGRPVLVPVRAGSAEGAREFLAGVVEHHLDGGELPAEHGGDSRGLVVYVRVRLSEHGADPRGAHLRGSASQYVGGTVRQCRVGLFAGAFDPRGGARRGRARTFSAPSRGWGTRSRGAFVRCNAVARSRHPVTPRPPPHLRPGVSCSPLSLLCPAPGMTDVGVTAEHRALRTAPPPGRASFPRRAGVAGGRVRIGLALRACPGCRPIASVRSRASRPPGPELAAAARRGRADAAVAGVWWA